MRRRVIASGIAALTLLSVERAHAGGFKIHQGGPQVGEAGAGSAAGGADASTTFFNPAGMTLLDGDAAEAAVNLFYARTRYDYGGSTNALGGPLGGKEDGSLGAVGVLPDLYVVHPVGERWRLGFALTSPYGLSTDYGDDWIGRYHATHSDIRCLDLGLSAAYRVDSRLSVGAGISAQYFEVRLDNEIDFGLIGLQALGPAGAAAAGLAPEQDDGSVSVRGSDWAGGVNAGVIFEPRCDTRLGLAWRSAIEHELRGKADFRVPADAAPLLAGGAFQDTGAKSKLTLPETVALGAVHELDARWTLLAGVEWTRWSRFEELRIRFDNPAQKDSVQPEDWNDAWRLSLGARWRPSDRWTYRAGVAWDQSPVPTATRTPRLPDADRIWVAGGVSLRVGRSSTVDLSYVHEFVEEAQVRQTSFPERGSLVGTSRSSVEYVSLAVSIEF